MTDFTNHEPGLTSPLTAAEEYDTTDYASADVDISPACRMITIYGKAEAASVLKFVLLDSPRVELSEPIAAGGRIDIPARVIKILSGSTVDKVRVAW